MKALAILILGTPGVLLTACRGTEALDQKATKGCPAPPSVEGGMASESILPAMLQGTLDEIHRLVERGELEEARNRLKATIEGTAYAQLLAADREVTLTGLYALEDLAKGLADLAILRVIQEDKVDRLSNELNSDHPDLLAAKQNLAGTRYQLGDPAGALPLIEHVHAARERLLPPDHLDLTFPRRNGHPPSADARGCSDAEKETPGVHARAASGCCPPGP